MRSACKIHWVRSPGIFFQYNMFPLVNDKPTGQDDLAPAGCSAGNRQLPKHDDGDVMWQIGGVFDRDIFYASLYICSFVLYKELAKLFAWLKRTDSFVCVWQLPLRDFIIKLLISVCNLLDGATPLAYLLCKLWYIKWNCYNSLSPAFMNRYIFYISTIEAIMPGWPPNAGHY